MGKTDQGSVTTGYFSALFVSLVPFTWAPLNHGWLMEHTTVQTFTVRVVSIGVAIVSASVTNLLVSMLTGLLGINFFANWWKLIKAESVSTLVMTTDSVDPLFHEVYHQVMSFRGVLTEYLDSIRWRKTVPWLDCCCGFVPGCGADAEEIEALEILLERARRTATILSASAFIVEYMTLDESLSGANRKKLRDCLENLEKAQSHMRTYDGPVNTRLTKRPDVESGLTLPEIINELLEHYHTFENDHRHLFNNR